MMDQSPILGQQGGRRGARLFRLLWPRDPCLAAGATGQAGPARPGTARPSCPAVWLGQQQLPGIVPSLATAAPARDMTAKAQTLELQP